MQRAYQPIDSSEDDYSYIKLWNLQSKVMCNKCFGRVAKMLVRSPQNPKSTYISHGVLYELQVGNPPPPALPAPAPAPAPAAAAAAGCSSAALCPAGHVPRRLPNVFPGTPTQHTSPGVLHEPV